MGANKQRVALITGITGQDGSYLAEFLLGKGYKVYGLLRRSSTVNLERVFHLKDQIEFVSGDLIDLVSLTKIINTVHPDEVYNLAAQSFVPASWDQPLLTGEVTALGVTRILEAIHSSSKNIRFYQASSSEMFGHVRETPQVETTPFYPRSPYGVAKVYGHWITINYRESYNMFACSGILFNHESPRRGLEFVTRKITYAAARIKLGIDKELRLGNLDARRDWGYAKDYVEAMWLMLQQEHPVDYVISSDETHSVQEFVDLAFGFAGLNWKDYVKVDAKFMRPAEVHLLLGDSTKARQKLGWKPRTNFKQLVELMVKEDMELVRSHNPL